MLVKQLVKLTTGVNAILPNFVSQFFNFFPVKFKFAAYGKN